MINLLVGILSALFKPIWAYRNNTLHEVTQRYNTILTNDLLKWKQNAHTLLHKTQMELIIKQITLTVLTDAHAAYKKNKKEAKIEAQNTLKAYWDPP